MSSSSLGRYGIETVNRQLEQVYELLHAENSNSMVIVRYGTRC